MTQKNFKPTEMPVSSLKDVKAFLKRAKENRKVEKTMLNEVSSRSHSIY